MNGSLIISNTYKNLNLGKIIMADNGFLSWQIIHNWSIQINVCWRKDKVVWGIKYWQTKQNALYMYIIVHKQTYPLISKFWKGINNDTKYDVQSNCGDNYKERQIKNGSWYVEIKSTKQWLVVIDCIIALLEHRWEEFTNWHIIGNHALHNTQP